MHAEHFRFVGGSLNGQVRAWPRARLYRVTPGAHQLQEVYEPVGGEMVLIRAFVRIPQPE